MKEIPKLKKEKKIGTILFFANLVANLVDGVTAQSKINFSSSQPNLKFNFNWVTAQTII